MTFTSATRYRHLATMAALLTSLAAFEAAGCESAPCNALGDDYPQSLLFRSEQLKKGISYERWAAEVSIYDGLIAKLQDEVLVGGKRNIDWYSRFKRDNPGKIVLAHYLYRQRNREDVDASYEPAHWLHYAGAFLKAPASANATELPLNSAGPPLDVGDVIDICAAQGRRPDWTRCEAVTVVRTASDSGAVAVARGQWGTRAAPITAGSYAAVRVQSTPSTADADDDGYNTASASIKNSGKPKGQKGKHASRKAARTGTLWWYNLGNQAPKGRNGLDGAATHAQWLGRQFSSSGPLAAFDGIAFDVAARLLSADLIEDGIDINGDGIRDTATDADANYSAGSYRFSEKLRTALGQRKLLIGEGWGHFHQRNFDQFNGMESEGWPAGHADLTMKDWSGGLNRTLFWMQNSYPLNRLTYFVYKYRIKGADQVVAPGISRLFQAGALFVGAAVTPGGAPNNDRSLNQRSKLMGEVRGYDGSNSRWLGEPKSEARHIALDSPNLFNDRTKPFIQGINGSKVKTVTAMRWSVTGGGDNIRFRSSDVSLTGQDITMFVTYYGDPVSGRPPAEGRAIDVTLRDSTTGKSLQHYFAIANSRPFTASYFSSGIKSRKVYWDFSVEGSESFTIDRMTSHASADAVVREFSRGLVIANPSTTPYRFELNRLSPNRRYAPIDPSNPSRSTMENSALNNNITLTKDAAFLRATHN